MQYIGNALITLLIVGVLVTSKVDVGNVGVVYDKFNGGVQEEVLHEGLHFVMPWQKVKEFSIATETTYMSADTREGSEENESINISCSDGSLNADLSFKYHFDSEKVSEVSKKFRGKNGQQIMNDMRGQLRGWVSAVTKNYTTMDVHLLKKEEINNKLLDVFNEKSKKYGVVFEEVTIMETRPSEEVLKAIEERQKIAQEVEQQKLQLEKSKVAKEQAQLEAERKLIEAEGERKANEAKTSGLTDAILKQQAIQKWDGKLPATMGADMIIGK